MASVTYKTVIANAIADFNGIQDALNSLGVKNGDYLITPQATPVATGGFQSLITSQLMLKPTGTNTIDSLSSPSGGYYTVDTTRSISVASGASSSESKSAPYQTFKIKQGSATNGNISGSSASVTIGSGTITLTKSISVTPTVSAGWVAAGTAANVTVTLSGGLDSAQSSADTANVEFLSTDGSNGGVNILSNLLNTSSVSTTEPTSGNYIYIKGSGNSKITSAGYISTGSLASASKSVYVPVKGATISANDSAADKTTNNPTVTLGLKNDDATGTGNEAVNLYNATSGATLYDSESAAKTAGYSYFLRVGGTSNTNTVTFTGSAKATAGGYIANGTSTTKQVTCAATASVSDKFIGIKAATAKNSATSNVTYAAQSVTVNTTDKKLYIDAGYIGNVSFDLGTLIPDIDGDAAAGHILNGYKAYSETGALLTGSMTNRGAVNETITTQGGTYTIPAGYHNGSGTVTANIDAATFSNVSGSSGVQIVSAAGYTATKSISGLTVPKDIAFTLTATADTALDSTSNIAVVNAAYRKVVLTNAANGTAEINGGAGTTTGGVTINGANGKTVSVSSGDSSSASSVTVTNASGFLTTTTLAAGNGSCSLNDSANVTTSDTNNGIFVKFAGNGTVTAGTGWNSTTSKSSNTAYSTKYITAITVPTTKNFTLTTATNSNSDTSTITITNGTNRILNINGGNADKGVKITGKTAIVDTVTVTTSSGDLITTSLTAGGGSISGTANSPTVGSATTFDSSTGVKTAGAKTAATTATASCTAVTYTNTAGWLAANTATTLKTPSGTITSGTATIQTDSTGATVDNYVESLYKRMLGKSYTAVTADS